VSCAGATLVPQAARHRSAGEAMGETHVSAEQPPSGEASRLPTSDVDPRRTGHPGGAPAQGSSAPVGLIWAVRDRRTFDALRRSRWRYRSGPLTVTWCPDGPGIPPRVAYAVSRRVGTAVARNRLRRRLRAAVRECSAAFGPGAFLVSASPGAASLPYPTLKAALLAAVEGARSRAAASS
jgi:ribonuclease P protein component